MKKVFYILLTCIPIFLAATLAFPLLNVGDKAPDFTLYGLKGDSVSLKNYKGKTTIIHLWSHTCPHCRESNQTLPDIVKPYRKTNMVYIMIDIDTDTNGVRTIIKEDQLQFAVHAIDPHDGAAKTAIDYQLKGTPCINVVDEKGTIAALNLTNADLKKFLKKKFPHAK